MLTKIKSLKITWNTPKTSSHVPLLNIKTHIHIKNYFLNVKCFSDCTTKEDIQYVQEYKKKVNKNTEIKLTEICFINWKIRFCLSSFKACLVLSSFKACLVYLILLLHMPIILAPLDLSQNKCSILALNNLQAQLLLQLKILVDFSDTLYELVVNQCYRLCPLLQSVPCTYILANVR